MIGSVVFYAGVVAALLGLLAAVRPLPSLRLGERARGVGLMGAGVLLALASLAWPASERRVARPTSPLDRFMPRYEFAERHVTRVDAPPAEAYEAIFAVTAADIRLFRTLTWIRRVGRNAPESLLNAPPDTPILTTATRTGFHALAATPERAVMFGAFGPVTPAARERVRDVFARFDSLATVATFATLSAPGFAKIAMDFQVTPDRRGGALVSTETRVHATDAATRRQFAAYWRVIYPGSALIRRSWLAAIARRAERGIR